MVNRFPLCRTTAKANIRPLIISEYGMISPVLTSKHRKHNLRIYRRIRVNDFHLIVCPNTAQVFETDHTYKAMIQSLDPRTQQYEHPALIKAFIAALFYARHAPAAIYYKYFKPVPIITMAFILTIVSFIFYSARLLECVSGSTHYGH
jgi:hypothetical protein